MNGDKERTGDLTGPSRALCVLFDTYLEGLIQLEACFPL